MQPLRLVSLVLVLAACGGSASRNPSGSPDVVAVAGEAGVDTGGSGVAAAAQGGMASSAPIGGEGGIAGSAAGNVGASAAGAAGGGADAGGQPSTGCALECLAGAQLVYWPNREWQRGSIPGSAGELLEADYQPKMGSPWDVSFSSDARQVVLTPRAGGDAVQGARDVQRTDRAWFELMLPIGGRLVVQGSLPAFQAEYSAYGSGVPIVSSTRGVLTEP